MTDLKNRMIDLQQAVVVSRGGDQIPRQVVQTPGTQANLLVTAFTPIYIIFVRTLRSYLQSLSGLLIAGGVGAASNVLPPGDFGHRLWVSAGLSLAPACMCALQNAIELLAKVDQSQPQLRP